MQEENVLYVDFHGSGNGLYSDPKDATITWNQAIATACRLSEMLPTIDKDRQRILKRWIERMNDGEMRRMIIFLTKKVSLEQPIRYTDILGAIGHARKLPRRVVVDK